MSMVNAAGKFLWPFVKQLLTQVATDAVKDTKTWENARGLVDGLNKAMASRSPEAKVQRSAAAVREYAQMALDKQVSGTEVVGVERGQDWIRRADQIENALSILKHEAGSARKAHLARLDQQASELVGESLNLLIGNPVEPAVVDEVAAPATKRWVHLPALPRRKSHDSSSEQAT